MYYEGGSTNRITIGRNMGWGTTDTRIEGALSLKIDLYHKSTDGKDKLWYATNAAIYYKGHGNASVFTINHEWRNHDDVKKMTLDYEGNLTVQNYIDCRLLTVAYDPHDFVGIAVNGTTLSSSGNYTFISGLGYS